MSVFVCVSVCLCGIERSLYSTAVNPNPVVLDGLALWGAATCHTAAMSLAHLSAEGSGGGFLRLGASQLSTLLYSVPARAAPHANSGHANNNTASQSTTNRPQVSITPSRARAVSGQERPVSSGAPRLELEEQDPTLCVGFWSCSHTIFKYVLNSGQVQISHLDFSVAVG